MLSSFGKLPRKSIKQRITASPNYQDGSFKNLEPTSMMAEGVSFLKVTKDFVSKQINAIPAKPFQLQKTNLKMFSAEMSSLVWFGHSSYFLNLHGLKVLVDPVLSGNASPTNFMVPSFAGTDLYSVDDFPDIDLLVITHDHYDHLDHRFVKQLQSKVKQVVCSLGVSPHLIHWGYDASKITELDWWEGIDTPQFQMTAVPGRHFSGRGLIRNQSLWSGFVLKTAHEKILLGGDSGYGRHFSEIGKRFGPFDLALLECGQYNTSWPNIHMMPEETVRAALDLGVIRLMPVHWGKFKLALHPWMEPAERVLAEALNLKQNLVLPAIGTIYHLNTDTTGTWWREQV
jgi:L-ascorbate metabolism protein UlaG (beta-lactamase superfamily)